MVHPVGNKCSKQVALLPVGRHSRPLLASDPHAPPRHADLTNIEQSKDTQVMSDHGGHIDATPARAHQMSAKAMTALRLKSYCVGNSGTTLQPHLPYATYYVER